MKTNWLIGSKCKKKCVHYEKDCSKTEKKKINTKPTASKAKCEARTLKKHVDTAVVNKISCC